MVGKDRADDWEFDKRRLVGNEKQIFDGKYKYVPLKQQRGCRKVPGERIGEKMGLENK